MSCAELLFQNILIEVNEYIFDPLKVKHNTRPRFKLCTFKGKQTNEQHQGDNDNRTGGVKNDTRATTRAARGLTTMELNDLDIIAINMFSSRILTATLQSPKRNLPNISARRMLTSRATRATNVNIDQNKVMKAVSSLRGVGVHCCYDTAAKHVVAHPVGIRVRERERREGQVEGRHACAFERPWSPNVVER